MIMTSQTSNLEKVTRNCKQQIKDMLLEIGFIEEMRTT